MRQHLFRLKAWNIAIWW